MDRKNYSFPAILFYDEDGISVEFPDLPGCLTCGGSTEEVFQNAKEAMGLHLYGMEQEGLAIPEPSAVNQIKVPDGAVLAMVDVFMPSIRDRVNNRMVKKTLTIPAWLNQSAEEAGVNFSQLLQDSLKSYLGARGN